MDPTYWQLYKLRLACKPLMGALKRTIHIAQMAQEMASEDVNVEDIPF